MFPDLEDAVQPALHLAPVRVRQQVRDPGKPLPLHKAYSEHDGGQNHSCCGRKVNCHVLKGAVCPAQGPQARGNKTNLRPTWATHGRGEPQGAFARACSDLADPVENDCLVPIPITITAECGEVRPQLRVPCKHKRRSFQTMAASSISLGAPRVL